MAKFIHIISRIRVKCYYPLSILQHKRHNVPGEDLVSKSKSQGETASGGGNREAKTIRETSLAPQLRLGTDVLRGGPTWYPGSASLYCGCHGQAYPCRSGGSYVHGTAWAPPLIMILQQYVCDLKSFSIFKGLTNLLLEKDPRICEFSDTRRQENPKTKDSTKKKSIRLIIQDI